MRILYGISAAALVMLGGIGTAGANLPLQVGAYQAENRSARIATLNDRLCVQFFALGTIVTASIDRRPDSLGVYRIERLDQVLVQPDVRSLLIGPPHELVVYTRVDDVPPSINFLMQECLTSRQDYLNQTNAVGSLEVAPGSTELYSEGILEDWAHGIGIR
ncbi:hypothetical protein [Thermoleptolyngbya sp. C42_A2020_037]|uniref:hypothetical protein n=1 Tax=Thermoleptolyngbya sp. C42_A2020_037 TaxID=2747799 RepID=UPI0019F3E962|nr:hypothetical protein [Thermoleptolyngbya sp. C42_A2020_037]MBF2086600.1 hypothetical protein [Thermoleptolyngbya sp. C42_A2020_037]